MCYMYCMYVMYLCVVYLCGGRAFAYPCVAIHMHVCVCVSVHVLLCAYAHIYIHAYMCIFIFMCELMCACMRDELEKAVEKRLNLGGL